MTQEAAWLRLHSGPLYTDNEIYINIPDTIEMPEWWYFDLIGRAIDDLKGQPGLVRRGVFPSRLIPGNTGHQDVLRLGKRWLQNCEDFHDFEDHNGTESPEWFPRG